jgi:hypothetical protein
VLATESSRMTALWRRALLGPPGATGVIAALTVVAVAVAMPAGFVLAWLLIGLTAGYALSGSA